MYSRKHILQATFFIILAGMTVSGYLLKPIDVKIAHYYESLSMYKEAIAAYEKSLEATSDQYFQREILVRISILCRYIGDYDKFLATVKSLLDLEYKSPGLMNDGLDKAIGFWRFSPANKIRQDNIIFFAKKKDNRDFLIDFLLGNQRLYEALTLYDKIYNSGNLTKEQMKKAVTVSRWTGDIQQRKKWLERAVDVIADAELTKELFIICVALGDEETAMQIASRITPKTLDDFLSLARLYKKTGDEKKARAFNIKAESICIERLAAIEDKGSDESKKLLTQLVYIYWENGNFESVIDTVEALYALGYKDKKLLDDALNASLHLWRDKPDNRENQERVIRIARNMSNQDFVVNFLVQNRRFSDALKIYEQKWRKGELSADSLKVAMEVAWSQNDRTLRRRWLERGSEALSHDKGLMDRTFNVSMAFWREDPDNRENQERVIRIAGNMGNEDFVVSFLVWNKRYSDALKIYETRWRRGELSPEDLKKAIEISYWQNDRVLQKKWFKRGIAESSDPEIMRKMAYIYLDDHEYQLAKKLFFRLNKIEPSNNEYLAKLAQLFEIEEDYRTAYDFYKRAYSETKNITYLERMVSCAYHLDQAVYEDALQESARRNPSEENLFRLASFYLYVSNEYEEANKVFDNMVHKWPLPKYQILLSYSFLQIGDNTAACDLLKHIPPKFRQPWGTQLLSKHYQEQGEWNKAIDVIKDYIKFHPDDTNTLLSLAYIYKRMNWIDEYQELIQSMLPPGMKDKESQQVTEN
jgi:tetratricopeptide (TPR) repeat protein